MLLEIDNARARERRRARGLVRRTTAAAALCAAVAALAPASAPAAAPAAWRALSVRMAAPWPAIQRSDGALPDYLDGIVGFPVQNYRRTRYGDAAMGWAMLQAGLRERDGTLVDSGLRAVSYATDPNRPPGETLRPSVFEAWCVAEAYNLARARLAADPAFGERRAQWEDWLRRVKTVRVGDERRYGNHWLVDANAVAALLATGLTSERPGTVLGSGRRAARRSLYRLVNRRIPRFARGHGPFILSDPPDNPAAYQALSLGLYAHLIDVLGTGAAPAARRVLARVADASWIMAAPDGDQAYFGRSQELVWAPAAALYGATVAARRNPSLAARFRALAGRSFGALRAGYPVTAGGQLVAPVLARSVQAGRRALDSYVGAPSMGGIALIMLNLAIDATPRTRAPAGRLAADGPLQRALGSGRSRFAVVRQGRVWLAAKLAPSAVHGNAGDLRYDFGVVSARRLQGGRWREVVPLRPHTPGARPDSAGPNLVVHGRTGYPLGAGIRFYRGGRVEIRGWYRTARYHRLRRAAVRYTPTTCGVRTSFSARRGDRFTLSYFFQGRPHASGQRRVAGPRQRVTANVPFSTRISGGYASGADAGLFRARIAIHTRRARQIRVTAC